jgi:hypothetical protein
MMNITSERTTTAYHPRNITLPAVRAPIYVRLMFMVAVGMTVLGTAWAALFRQATQPLNPFAEMLQSVVGESWQAVGSHHFSCSGSAGDAYCTRRPTDGPFSLIAVTLRQGVVSRVEFSMHEGALTAGDLALLWGRPDVDVYHSSVNLEWPRIGLSANGWADAWQFSFAIPVERISFVVTS